MSTENVCTYYTCWYNQETKLLLTAEGGRLPSCNVVVNECAKTVALELETSGNFLPTWIISVARWKYLCISRVKAFL